MPIGTAIRGGLLAGKAIRYASKLVNMQDNIINQALRTAPSRNILGKSGIYGVRTGAAIGALSSPFIGQKDDNNLNGGWNGISKKIQFKYTPRTTYKTRVRQTGRCRPEYPRNRRYRRYS